MPRVAHAVEVDPRALFDATERHGSDVDLLVPPSDLDRAYAALTEPPDELVFLAVHAAAHRFVRLGWFYDLHLLVKPSGSELLAVAGERARSWGDAEVLALARRMLGEVFERSDAASKNETRIRSAAGQSLAGHVLGQPRQPTLRAATRFIYTASLCDTTRAAVRYAARASAGRVRRLLWSSP